MFGNNHHTVLPSSGGVDWDSLQYTQPTVPIQTLLDTQLPVEGDLGWNMYSYRLGIRVKVEFEGRTTFHEGKLLPFTTVESRRFVSLHYPFFQFREVVLSCWARKYRRFGWSKSSDRT